MRQILFFTIFFFSLLHSDAQQCDDCSAISVMTYNIRNSNAKDSINSWEFRKENLAAQVLYHHPDIIGMQEALPDQLHYLHSQLKQYNWYGVGRNKEKSNEYSPVFYRKDKFDILDSATFWLSETPKIPSSKGWDAALPRICSWVKLKDKRTKQIFFFFNTHLDHVGKLARKNGVELILKEIAKLSKNSPVIFTGDFNFNATTENYKRITLQLKDAQFISNTTHYGPLGTSSGFWVNKPVKGKIDFIFVSRDIKVLQHAVLTDQMEGRYFSDHLPVITKIIMD